MLKIRLMRIGAKKRPFYRVVVVDERNKRNGAYLDLIGTYNPLTTPKEIKLDMKKIEEWVKKGAQKSDGLLRILKEAPQRHSKPKKAPEVKPEAAPKAEEAQAEDSTETPTEEVSEESQPEEQIATEPEAPRNDEDGEKKEEEAAA